MRKHEKTTAWERTAVQNLLRNRKSGRYYGRWTISGKQKWVALDTDVFTVAKLRLADEAAKISRVRNMGSAVASGTATMGELMQTLLTRIAENSELRPATKVSWQTAVRKIEKTWPELAAMKPASVTPAAVEAWAHRFKAEGTNFRPNGSKTICKGNSARSVNRAIDALARAFDIAIEQGALHRNPAKVTPKSGRLKKRVTHQRLTLPSREELARLFAAMENNGAKGGWGREAADFCRFMAFSGARRGEAAMMTWDKVDWQRSLVHLPGYKTEASDRIIPLFQDLAALLRAVQERRKLAARFSVNGKPDLAQTDSIFRLSECQKTIDAACAKTGCPRITHHDLRHVFATVCIESGVDIPTVSRWLGHADGGALAMRTYGHLRQEHSQAQAAKVAFQQSANEGGKL